MGGWWGRQLVLRGQAAAGAGACGVDGCWLAAGGERKQASKPASTLGPPLPPLNTAICLRPHALASPQANGQRARLTPEVGQAILDTLDAAEAALPAQAETRSLLPGLF